MTTIPAPEYVGLPDVPMFTPEAVEARPEVAIDRPQQVFRELDHGTSRLFFAEGSTMPSGEYHMRGGIAWPTLDGVVSTQSLDGFALMAGQHVDSGVAYVFECMPFVCIDHVLAPDRSTITVQGLAPWFNRVWLRYYADAYYWDQDPELAKTYRLQVLRSEMIEPKPQFPMLPKSRDHVHAWSLIRHRVATKRLYWRRADLNRAVQEYEVPPHRLSAAVLALMACGVGLERFRYRKPEDEEEE